MLVPEMSKCIKFSVKAKELYSQQRQFKAKLDDSISYLRSNYRALKGFLPGP